MFDKIVSRTLPQISSGLDVGTLAEVLLFYRETRIVLDYGTLIGLLKAIGEENLFFLVDSGFVKLSYSMSQTGVYSHILPGLASHSFISFQLGGMKPTKPQPEKQLTLAYERSLHRKNSSRFVKKILDAAEIVEGLDDIVGTTVPLNKLALEKISDRSYVRKAASIILSSLVPSIKTSQEVVFDAIILGEEFLIDTNIDFEKVNMEFHKSVPPSVSTVTPALLMSYIWSSVVDLNISAKMDAELLAGDMYNSIINARFEDLETKIGSNRQKIDTFNKFVFEDGRSIREAINSGVRNFDDFRPVLEKSRGFRKWLDGVDPSADLIKAYHNDCFADTWVNELPAKSIRFSTFTGAGLILDALIPTGIGTFAGIGLGLADTFLLDKIIGGFTPRQFVNGPLKDFIYFG